MSDDKHTPTDDELPDDGIDQHAAGAADADLAEDAEEQGDAGDAGDADVADVAGDEEPEGLYTKADVDAIRAEAQDRLLRVVAEYDNFRRRTAREKEQWIADALEDFVKDLLPVFDSFEKALETGTDGEAAAAAIHEGLVITQKQLRGVLDKYRIEVLDPVGQPFDPAFHEALMRQPSPDHEPGTVVNVFERGYKLGSRLIRPARTVVAAGD